MAVAFGICFHLGGAFVSEEPIRYAGEVQCLTKKWEEDPDLFCEFDILNFLHDNGYKEPVMMAYKPVHLTLPIAGELLTGSKEFVKMIKIACEQGIVDVYVQEKKSKVQKGAGQPLDGVTSQTAATNNLNASIDEEWLERLLEESIVQKTNYPQQIQSEEHVEHTEDAQEEAMADAYEEYMNAAEIGVEEEECVSGDECSSDEELTGARKVMKELRRKISSGFVINDHEDDFTNVSPDQKSGGSDDYSEKEGQHYHSDYNSTEDEQDSPVPSDIEDIFAYKMERKQNKVSHYDSKCDHKTLEFDIGLRFDSPTQFKEAVRLSAVENGREIRWKQSSYNKMDARCIAGCKWKVYASWLQEKEAFVVKSVFPDHTCTRSLRNKQATASWLAKKYLHKFRINPNWPPSEMLTDLMEKYSLTVTTRHCYRARTKALRTLRGTLEEHYGKLRSYIAEMQRVDKEGTFIYEPQPDTEYVFKRLYIGFSSLRKNYLEVGRNVFGVDGAFLKTMLGGCLLAAVGRDSNNQMYPLAWAVVDSENEINWNWFMGLLGSELQVNDGFSWTVITDGQKGLANAIRDHMPQAEHRLCARHVYGNWKKKWKGDELKNLFWRAVNCTNEWDFDKTMEAIKEVDMAAYEEFISKGPKKFCKSFFSYSVRCDASENNMCEAFNGTICRARTKPLIHMLEDIRNYVMERIYSKQNLMSHDLLDDTLCPRIKKKLEKLVQISARSVARPSVGGLFQVHEGVDAYSVCLNERTCTCKGWQLTGLPCRHAIASISFMRVDPSTYVDDVYRKHTHKKYYKIGLPPMNGERMWPKAPGEPIKPPPYRVMPGRPKKKRKKAPEEEPKRSHTLKRSGLKMKCTNCSTYGHNKRKCPQPLRQTYPQPKRKKGRPLKSSTQQPARTTIKGNGRRSTKNPRHTMKVASDPNTEGANSMEGTHTTIESNIPL